MKFLIYFIFTTGFISTLYAFKNDADIDNKIDVIIVLKKQVDHSKTNLLKNKNDKGWYIYNESKKIATYSQKEIINYLNQNNFQYQSFHIINSIHVPNASPELIQYLKKMKEVDYIQNNEPISLMHQDRFNTTENYSRDIQWGIEKINADRVWDELGIKGEGAIVAGQDTGYDWMHPALRNSYRGWNGNDVEHHYNWHDAIHEYSALHAVEENNCGLDVGEPCDDSGHGTHTMGTMVGVSDDEQIGVAPEAKWIACRSMERGWGTPASYIECFEWFLAPTDLNGEQADVSKSPHVINNSWACPEIEGCNLDNFNTMRIVVDNLKAAGIMVVVSAGNSGSNGCESVSSPASIFGNSFTVGASSESDSLARFSSMGAVSVDGSMRTKPNVVAPGVNVRSSILGDNYGLSSGTSMAGPHVAGVVALMISANPNLAGQVERIETILEQTAVPIHAHLDECNGTSISDIPNNIIGYGRIDAYAAVKAALNDAFEFNNEGLFVFPNPSNAEFQFLIPTLDTESDIFVWDASGKLVLSRNIFFGMNGGTLDLSSFSNGVYFYQLKSADSVFTGKLLKH